MESFWHLIKHLFQLFPKYFFSIEVMKTAGHPLICAEGAHIAFIIWLPAWKCIILWIIFQAIS